MGNVLAVIGGQYGSEGKGVIVNHIAHHFDVHVRVGGPNAGHSFYHEDQLFKMQSVPCGWTNKSARLVLGAGALIDPERLKEEIREIRDRIGEDISRRLYIDGNASVLDQRFHEEEGGVGGELHQRIGSTGEGVGAVRHARMRRDPRGINLWKDVYGDYGFLPPSNTVRYLELERKAGTPILLEGTQGSGLSLTHGPWPYTTSADTNAATLAADCGIPPQFIKTLMVIRTYPIRVAGNSGPLKDETSWAAISEKLGTPTEERTTVTKKTRRIGNWDQALFEKSVSLNAPDWIALTFCDYLDPRVQGNDSAKDVMASPLIADFVDRIERYAGCEVRFLGTGGEYWSVAVRGGHYHWNLLTNSKNEYEF